MQKTKEYIHIHVNVNVFNNTRYKLSICKIASRKFYFIKTTILSKETNPISSFIITLKLFIDKKCFFSRNY